MIEIQKAMIERAARLKDDPAGYRAAIAAVAIERTETVLLKSEDYYEIRRRFPSIPEPSRPTILRNFASALAKWVKAGIPVVDEETFRKRDSICSSCPNWHPAGNLGFGKCQLCGCSKGKLWLATERCPVNHW